MPGETAEQWRGEGSCERVPLQDFMDRLPHYTITAMVSSKRIEKEKAKGLLEPTANGVRTVSYRTVVCDGDEIQQETTTTNILYYTIGTHCLLLANFVWSAFSAVSWHTLTCCATNSTFRYFKDRLMMENKSHMIEIMQKTRIELENGDITDEEKDESIRVRTHAIH
jgi:hypothetical protein